MKNLKVPLLIAAIALLFLFFFFAANRQTVYEVSKTPPTFKRQQAKSLLTGERTLKLCPKPSALVYSHLKWTAPGGWKSVDKPLSKTVGRFRKAQWQGVNLGEIICQYSSSEGAAFPIELQRLAGKIVFEPTDSAWKTTSSGVKTCFSNRVNGCSFYDMKTKKRKSYPVIYKEIFGNKK